MKRFKISTLVMCCLAAMSLTLASCDTDDDGYKSLTKEEVKAAFNTVKGDYVGKLIYEAPNVMNTNDNTDTTAVSWSINTDSTLHVKSFPIATIAYGVKTNTDEAKAFKLALEKQPSVDIDCKIGFVTLSPIQFIINPSTVTLTMNWSGKDHKVQIPFMINYARSFGQYNSNKNILNMQIAAAAIYVDGQPTSLLDGKFYLFESTSYAFH